MGTRVEPTASPPGRFLVFYCGLLMSLGAFSVDITLPSIPAMVAGLDAPYALVQWTVTVYILVSGIGQLFWGAASDRFGRKATIATGLGLYLAGSLIALAAPGIAVLLAGRALQGLGAASAMVASRAMIRDVYSGEELARNLALASMFFALGPIVAPLVGSVVAEFTGWRAIFALLSGWSVILLVLLVRIPETIVERSPDALSLAVFAERTGRLVRHPQSRRFLVVSAVIMSAMLLILSAAPRIYEANFGITGVTFALFFAVHGTGIVIGQWANRRMIRRFGIVAAAAMGNAVLIAAMLGILAVWAAGLMNPFVLSGLLVLFATSYLIVYSNAGALVLDPHGAIAGHATAIFGFSSQLGGALIVSAMVVFVGGDIGAWAGSILAICLINLALVATWTRIRPAPEESA